MKKRKKYLYTFLLLLTLGFSANADVLGDQKTFFTNTKHDQFGRESLDSTLRAISANAYYYVENKYWNTLNLSQMQSLTDELEKLANEFESVIYPRSRQIWGAEPNPGVDGDPRITILLEDLVTGSGGYFESSNLYPKSQVSDSNEREMFAASVESLGTQYLKNFLAHELQHLISFNQKEKLNNTTEDVWLNELRSEYAISAVGYNDVFFNSNLERRMQIFTENPSDSLTEWPNKPIDYALAAIFGEYLVGRFGSGILTETLNYKSYGIPSLNQFLAAKGTNFADVFTDWMAASYLNDQSLDSKYGYSRSGLDQIKVRPQATMSMFSPNFTDYLYSASIKDWQPTWLEYDFQRLSDPAQSLKLELSNLSNSNYLASHIVLYENGQKEVKKIPVASGKTNHFVMNSPDKRLNKVILMLTSSQKLADFSTNELSYRIDVQASLVDALAVQEQMVKDGSLIKKVGGNDYYVVEGQYKRYLHPSVIKLYGHLDPAKAIEVFPQVFDSYKVANYIRNVNDKKVYAVRPEGTKHWLNMTAQYFEQSGRDWNAIFIINDLEYNFYKTGPDVTR